MKTQIKLDINSFDLSIVEKCRFSIRNEAVERYKSAIENAGNKWIFPPLSVWQDNGTNYLLDGHHRLLAVQQIEGFTTVPVILKTFATISEARRYALHANSIHGERLTREETRANIRAYLQDGGAIDSDTAIANLFGVSRVLVADVRTNKDGMTKKEKAMAEVAKILSVTPQATITEIAEKANLSRATAKKIAEAVTKPSEEAPKGIVKDCFGREIPQDNIEKQALIKSSLKVCSSILNDFALAVDKLVLVGGFARTSEVEQIDNAIDVIKHILKTRKPDALCTCRGDGCRKCGGVGFLEKTMFNVIIPESDK
jgi:hypothetical protein